VETEAKKLLSTSAFSVSVVTSIPGVERGDQWVLSSLKIMLSAKDLLFSCGQVIYILCAWDGGLMRQSLLW